MATIVTKIVHATAYEVRLYKEGIFWVGYEQSAYYVATLKGYKASKKWYKNVEKEIVKVGFPVVDDILKVEGISLQCQQDDFVCFTVPTALNPLAFGEWKSQVPPYKQKNIGLKSTLVKTQGLIERVLHFDVSNNTPVEALVFVNDLKHNIINGNL